MKLYLAMFMFVLLQAALFSRDFTTLSGTAYKDVKVCESNAAELTISYQDKDKPELTVMKSIPFTDLPDEIKKEFKHDPVKAEAFEKARDKAMKQKENDVIAKKAEDESPNTVRVQTDTPTVVIDDGSAKKGEVINRSAPGEKNGPAEADKIREDATKEGIAPGEKNGPAEADKIREDAR